VGASAFESLVRRTPLVPAPALGADVWLKLESLQRTGSFKLRGACLAVDALGAEARARGVVAASAGNHGQGMALAGRHAGVRVTVVVPRTAPAVKKRAMAALGAEVVEAGDGYDAAEAAARALAAERGAVFVSPFDDEQVIRGNGGTLAEEILAERPDARRVVCPVGGGGLCGGLAQALAPRGVAVVGVQPAVNCAMAESLADGRARTVYEGGHTLAEGCDGAVAERTFRLCRDGGVRVALVDERAIRRALAFAYRRLGVVCEATSAVAIAGLVEGAVAAGAGVGATVVVVTGGNIEPDLLDEVLGEYPAP
jgi:threonine dehydratase